jgi:Xaa-Pro aminopeptidase
MAVVGNYDAPALEASGDWNEVVPYVQSIREPLIYALKKLIPAGAANPWIAVNYSTDDVKSDGLSHGMFLLLEEYFRGTRFEGSLVSADEIVMPLRSRKTAGEITRIRAAISESDELFDLIDKSARIGMSERELYDLVQREIDTRGLGYSWDRAGNPIVNSGPDSMIGHGIPSPDIRISPGHILHIDLGVTKDGYSSDVQSCWYIPEPGETAAPDDVRRATAAVVGAISAGAVALRPGVAGWEVDSVAREFIQQVGYPEYMHALGHQVGRVAHDGGGILGPRWERYGRTPYLPVEKDQVYTIELGVPVEGRGYLGIEEMVVVTEGGCEWLTGRQVEMEVLSRGG